MKKITHINVEGLDIELTRKSGLKNIYLRVKGSDGVIRVSASPGVSLDLIEEFISCNIPRIIKAREKIFSQHIESEQEFITGETFYLWGKPYILDVKPSESKSKSYSVKVSGEKIILTVPEDSSRKKREDTLNELCRSELKRVLPDLVKACAERVGVQVNSFTARKMKSCWGTCHTKKKHIIISLCLAQKPPECLEYVVIHELVHLIEKNHTPRFHELVAKNFPAERRVKALLTDSDSGI